MIFPLVIYGCEFWTIQKIECQRTDAFKLWCLRLLRILGLQGGQTSQSKRSSTHEYSLEGMMLELKCLHFGHLMQRANSLEKILILGKI